MRYLIRITIVMLISACQLFGGRFSEYEVRVREKVLDNGLRVLILERHTSPTAAFVNYVDIGAVNQFAGQSGAAHFLEHLAFHGTKTVGTTDYKKERRAIDELDRAFETLQAETQKSDPDSAKLDALLADFEQKQAKAASFAVENEFGITYETEGGVGLNAYTSTDQTVYHLSLPSNKYELWCAMESDRIANPVYRLFYKERDVIREERLTRYDDNPSSMLYEEFASVFYKGHPYRDSVIGHRSEISQLMRDDIERFYATYYYPANMTLVIVGDVDADCLFPMLERYFGRIPSRGDSPRVRMKEPESVSEKRVTMFEDVQPYMLVGYQIPEARHPDFVPLSMLAKILGSGRTSRLYKRIVTDEQKALYAGAYTQEKKYPSALMFYLYPAPGFDAESLLVETDEEIRRIIDTPPDSAELEKVKNSERAAFIFGLESNLDIALSLGTFQGVYGDWRELFRYVDKLDEVSPQDVQRVAIKYLSTRNRTIAQIRPKAEKEVD